MAVYPISKLESHAIGSINVNPIINSNWEQLELILTNTGAGAGILATAVGTAGYPAANQTVTLSGVQTLTNKTLTSPTINSPTLTSAILGTPASGNLTNCTADGVNPVGTVTLNGTQTLTNKTLTSPTLTSPVLGTPASGNLSNCTADGTRAVGGATKKLRAVTTNTALTLDDVDGIIYHAATDASARTVGIPDQSSINFPIGAEIEVIVEDGAGTLDFSTTTDALPEPPAGTPNHVFVSGPGRAWLTKVASGRWAMQGFNIS